MAPHTNGYYEYLPRDYAASDTQTYPLILFLHGGGEIGNGDSAEIRKMLWVGLPAVIQQGRFPETFTVGDKVFKFIVIAPQFEYIVKDDAVNSIETIINYLKKNYKVDTTRVYITGLSMGGGFTFDFAGKNAANAGRLAAVVPIAGSSPPVYAQARVIANANLPVWATHNDQDPTVSVINSQKYIDWINEDPAPTPRAKLTILSGKKHDAWSQTYDPNFRENGLNIYEWMLQYKRTPPPPVPQNVTRSIVLYPNPVKDKLKIRIESSDSGTVTATIYSINGALVKQWTVNKQTQKVNVESLTSTLQAGPYVLELRLGDYKETRLFIKH